MRRDSLPEAQLAKQAKAEAEAAADRAVLMRTETSDLQREVRKLEDEVDRVRARSKRDAELLDSGSVSNVRQLSELQHEIASLKRRQDDLEEAELELLEQLEGATSAQHEAEQQRDELAEAAQQASAAASTAMQELAEQYRSTKAERAELAGAVPDDLLRLYERIRADRNGIGAADFSNDLCGACRLQLPPADLAAVKTAPIDEVVRCEECSRILVRTAMLGR